MTSYLGQPPAIFTKAMNRYGHNKCMGTLCNIVHLFLGFPLALYPNRLLVYSTFIMYRVIFKSAWNAFFLAQQLSDFLAVNHLGALFVVLDQTLSWTVSNCLCCTTVYKSMYNFHTGLYHTRIKSIFMSITCNYKNSLHVSHCVNSAGNTTYLYMLLK